MLAVSEVPTAVLPMTHLDEIVRYETLVARGMLDLYDEARVRRWMDGREEITVAEALQSGAPTSVIFWAVLREYLVGEHVLHQIAVDVANEVVDRQRAQGTYIDFRFERALAAKQAWLDGHLSLGELVVAANNAERAATDVAELDDPQVSTVAKLACQALISDADDAVSQTYYSFLDVYGKRDDHAWLIALATKCLGQ
jgi:hypothetical protein